jgi:16S rRNA (uracil1498-N3)-methyltransferase
MRNPTRTEGDLFAETWFYSPELDGDATSPLPNDEGHHAFGVLRLRAGQDIVVCDGLGLVLRCRLEGSREHATVTPLAPYGEASDAKANSATAPQAALALALLKGRDCEDPIAAACELPLSDVYLLITDHAQVFAGQEHERLVTRLQQKSIVALKQARKPFLTRIHAPQTLSQWRLAQPDLTVVLAHPGGDTLPTRPSGPFALMVGPEGGFSEKELTWLSQQSASYRLDLGATRLRAVHAPLVGLGKLMGLGWL